MRVSIFDILDDGRIVFRAGDRLGSIMPERDDAYEDALEALYDVGFAHVGGGAAPEVLLVRTGTDAGRERRVLRRQIALRAQRAVQRDLAASALPPIDARALMMALIQAEDTGCRLRLRDLAAAAEADVVHDVLGIVAHQHRVTGAVDLAVFRPRFLAVDGPAAAAPETAAPETAAPETGPVDGRTRAADRARIGRARMELHRVSLSLEALAADAAPPWQVDETDTAADGCIVIRDADGGYVCELDLAEFEPMPFSPENQERALRQARDVAQLICAAVVGKVPGEALERDLAEAHAEAPAETVGASHG